MIPGRIEGASRVLGAPVDWDLVSELPCSALAVRVDRSEGLTSLVSAWFPSADELAALQAGAPVHLHIFGATHPVVALSVGQSPEA